VDRPPSSTLVDDPIDGATVLPKVVAPFERAPDERVNWKASIPFLLVHVLAVAGTIYFGITWKALILFVALVWGRVWFITAGYHRYFAHRTFKTNRAFQLFLAVGGAMCVQKGPLWWAGHHRNHHRYSDTEVDVHSPLRGFWWSHVGWILCDKYKDTPYDKIRDFAKFPELRFVEKHQAWFPWTLGVISFLIAGWPGLFFSFFLGTVVLWRNTFLVNSLAHVMGRRRYVTDDTSRNSLLIAITTLGEGWHNNHHYYQASARNGFFWWELDVTWYVLKALSWVGIVKDLKVPTKEILDGNRIKNGNFDVGMYKAHWAKAQAYVAHARVDDRIGTLHLDEGGADGSLAARRDAVELAIETEKVATDQRLHEAMASAEALAKTTRRAQRDLGLSGSSAPAVEAPSAG
jgi:stearoyl-CoA desaturase (delta-9 desaturase)